YDAFLYDRVAGTIVRVSTDANGNAANGRSDAIAIAPDGSRIAIATTGSNLASGDNSATYKLVVADRVTGAFSRADVGAAGTLPNAQTTEAGEFSGDGRYIVFSTAANSFIASDNNPYADVFRK